ncbi:MAG: glutamate-1-semialdehyde 2,1-aminomutase [Candidatus Sumerlaeaceae bacterium]
MSVRPRSSELFERAGIRIPGGVNSPVRAFKAVGGTPPFIVSGNGATLTDADGIEYIDYVGSYGPLLFGHAPSFVVEAISNAAAHGSTYGAPTQLEVELAELVCEIVPSIEMVRFVNSGSEATTSAVRLARGVTGRSKIVKCAGCFHGSVDALLATAGSGVATLGIPETAGVPAVLAAETIVVEYNDVSELQTAFEKYGTEIAAFIVEPIAGNMGLVAPAQGYLRAVREITRSHGALLIFDEVITGFRVAPGGAQELYAVQPDLTCLGKILGGGVPCGAYGGSRELMENLAPVGPVYQAGTLSGNPLAMSAGLAILREIKKRGPALYHQLDALAAQLSGGLTATFDQMEIPVQVQRVGSLLTAFFSDQPVTNYRDAKRCDISAFRYFFHSLLDQGIYLAPSQYECVFVSAAHTSAHVESTLEACRKALAQIVA